MEAEGKVAKQTGKFAWYARVRVACEVTEADSDPPVSAVDGPACEIWRRAAAIAGVSWALEVAGVRATCAVKEVEGVPCDTNPTLVAIAAARAVWTALQFTPEASLAARIEEAIISSWQVPEGQLGLPPYDRQGGR